MVAVGTAPESVPIGLLRRYLRAQQWNRVQQIEASDEPRVTEAFANAARRFAAARGTGTRAGLVELWRSKEDGFELLIPGEFASSTARARIDSTVKTIASYEDRSLEEVVASIRAIGFDRVFSRVPDSMVVDDSVHLAIAASFITDIRELLAATYTTEMQPTAFYPRLRPEATKYADRCRFGHTFRGSFGFTVESPLTENSNPPLPLVDEIPPIERKVIQRLARGVAAAVKAVDTQSVEPLVESIEDGFGANACDKFADLIEETSPGGLIMSFAFSPEWKAAPEFIRPPEYRVDTRHVEVARDAVKVMRAKPIIRSETIHGHVSDLHTDDPWDMMNNNTGRHITVVWSSEDLGDISVHVSLSPEHYMRAVDAHRNSKAVRINGTLQQRARSWILTDVAQFTTEDRPAE